MHALAKMAEMTINRQNRHFRQNRQPPRGHFWHPIQIASFAIFAIACMAIFAKIANFAKIASLQGATFGIQFKSPAAGYFSPVSPFSPLHAFLDISGKSSLDSISRPELGQDKRSEPQFRHHLYILLRKMYLWQNIHHIRRLIVEEKKW